jgi:hypothetical protein
MDLNVSTQDAVAQHLAIVSTERAEVGSSQPLKLFIVTLAWNPLDSGEGDYCDTVWAVDEDDAVKQLAEEMAQHEDSGAETAADREKFIANAIENASNYAALCVASQIASHLRELMAGPGRVLGEEALADLASIKGVMAKYGVKVPA